MAEKIRLGYEIGTGEEVEIEPAHLIVTGLTQQAGKTTTLESLITRSGKRAIVFRTKIGEKSFIQGTVIPPFFRDRSDWQFVQGLVEATIKEKLRSFERAKIIQICKQAGNNSLIDFKKRVDARLVEPKLSGFEKDILTNLQAYLEIVLPKLQTINFSNTLDLTEGVNIIDLERFSRDPEVQSLIIRSVAEEVLHKFKDVILVVPEAWKFVPQGRGNPCKPIIEEFIRQGATNRNFIWIDSQDMTGVDKTPLKQVSTWILGYQSERNEVHHTLEQIPLPKQQRPKESDIMSLQTGVFYFASRDRTQKVYVQPFWLDDERARKVAMGELSIKELDAPKTLTPHRVAIPQRVEEAPKPLAVDNSQRVSRELGELREDFFNKVADIQQQVNRLAVELHNVKSAPQPTIDENAIVGKVLQKIPVSAMQAAPASVNKEEIIREVLARVPSGGMVKYEVAPLEKIKKDFLEEAKQKIIEVISALSPDAKRSLKYIECQGKGVSTTEVTEKGFLLRSGGGNNNKVLTSIKELASQGIARCDPKGKTFPALRDKITSMLSGFDATEQEIELVYNHILMEMLK